MLLFASNFWIRSLWRVCCATTFDSRSCICFGGQPFGHWRLILALKQAEDMKKEKEARLLKEVEQSVCSDSNKSEHSLEGDFENICVADWNASNTVETSAV